MKRPYLYVESIMFGEVKMETSIVISSPARRSGVLVVLLRGWVFFVKINRDVMTRIISIASMSERYRLIVLYSR